MYSWRAVSNSCEKAGSLTQLWMEERWTPAIFAAAEWVAPEASAVSTADWAGEMG